MSSHAFLIQNDRVEQIVVYIPQIEVARAKFVAFAALLGR